MSNSSPTKIRIFAVASLLFFSLSQVSPANAAGGESPIIAPAPAAPTTSPTPSAKPAPAIDQLALSRTLIEAKNYKQALTELKRVDRLVPNNADVNNYLGFASRKLAQYTQASTYYTKALKINPSHLGALEYQGELFLTQKKVAPAKQNLAKLKRLCGTSCEEYLDLNQAIAASTKKQ